ncbi:thioredoxin domain-containing protein [Candidatus Peregrinibacteria bacterium]|nr:thioredoxin domain-containing protein [Candidatus Peregrinibacteria bacterium]
MKEKKIRLPGPWMLASFALLLILAGLLFYDKSPTFRNNINYLLGLTEVQIPEGEPREVNLVILTDKFFVNPPYDVDDSIDKLKEEIISKLNVKTVDINDDEGKQLIEEYNITTIPVFIFDESFGKTSIYKEAAPYFTAEKNHFLLKLDPFKFLVLPEAGDGWVREETDMAKVTIIEYSSFTCPYCEIMRPVFDQALQEYPGKIKLVYKHFNRGGLDPLIENASECAGEQGKFWEMHDYIYSNRTELVKNNPEELFLDEAENLGLDTAQFEICVKENKYLDKIEKQTQEAYSFAVSGTPGIFVNDVFIGGAVDYNTLKKVIDSFNP